MMKVPHFQDTFNQVTYPLNRKLIYSQMAQMDSLQLQPDVLDNSVNLEDICSFGFC